VDFFMRLVLAILLLLLSPALAHAQSNGTTAPPVAAAPAGTTERSAEPSLPAAEQPAPETVAQPTSATPSPGAAALSPSILPKDLSVWGMFMAADWLVQAVMVGLAVASVITWTVFVAKSLELATAFHRQRAVLRAVDGAASLDDAPANPLVAAAQAERKLSADSVDDREGLKERVASRLERLESAAGRSMLKGTGVLATIGATAPFVGLFGTVWGIMNSFIGISRSQTTNLAVVAPGIAEALLATALGLAAAIPAVVIYNHFSRRIAAYRALVGDTSAAVLRLVSRDIGKCR
jgi:biopolymer transport protein ExbB